MPDALRIDPTPELVAIRPCSAPDHSGEPSRTGSCSTRCAPSPATAVTNATGPNGIPPTPPRGSGTADWLTAIARGAKLQESGRAPPGASKEEGRWPLAEVVPPQAGSGRVRGHRPE